MKFAPFFRKAERFLLRVVLRYIRVGPQELSAAAGIKLANRVGRQTVNIFWVDVTFSRFESTVQRPLDALE